MAAKIPATSLIVGKPFPSF